MMDNYISLYDTLGIPRDSSDQEIKSAFRKLAMKYHPDACGNTPGSQAAFIIIHNAYAILSDRQKREEYDHYLSQSGVFQRRNKKNHHQKRSLPGRKGDVYWTNEDFLHQFLYLLWDIEDFIRSQKDPDWDRIYNNKSVKYYVLRILAMIDKWILIPAGFPDYFSAARKIRKIDPFDHINYLQAGHVKPGHYPYVGISDYFYDIRKRMDRFVQHTSPVNLVKKLPGRDVRLIDCVIEIQNYTLHYLSYLLKIQSGEPPIIPPFEHSHPCFME
jgi:curved DNA-binding protein CbpA